MSLATHRRGESTHRGGKNTHRGGRSTHNRGGTLLDVKSRKPHKIRLFRGFPGESFSAIRTYQNEVEGRSHGGGLCFAVRTRATLTETQKKEVINQ